MKRWIRWITLRGANNRRAYGIFNRMKRNIMSTLPCTHYSMSQRPNHKVVTWLTIFRFDHMFSSTVAAVGASSSTIVRIKLIATTFINTTLETEGAIIVFHFRSDEKMVRKLCCAMRSNILTLISGLINDVLLGTF